MITDKEYSIIYNVARKNAKQRGIEFLLTKEDFWRLVNKASGRCVISKIEFDCRRKENAVGTRRPFAPSLDRIDSSKGYTFKNCRLVCVIVNLALNDWGTEPFFRMCRAVYAIHFTKYGRKRKTPNNNIVEKMYVLSEYM